MHFTTKRFWKCWDSLPENVQQTANQNYRLLKADPLHPSVQFKKVGQYWSVRVGKGYRALGIEVKDGISWFWLGCGFDYAQPAGSAA